MMRGDERVGGGGWGGRVLQGEGDKQNNILIFLFSEFCGVLCGVATLVIIRIRKSIPWDGLKSTLCRSFATGTDMPSMANVRAAGVTM